MTTKGITVKFGADCGELAKALTTIDKQAKSVNSDITNINKALKFDKSNMSLLGEKFSKLSQNIQLSESRLTALKSRQQEYENLFKNNKIDGGQYAAFQNEIHQTEIRLQSLRNQARQTSDALTANLRETVSKVKDDFTQLTTVVAAAETALIAFSAKSVSAGMNFDSAMSNVAAISGASGEEIDTLNAKAQELGESTVYSATEAAEALSYMALAGWDTESMLEGIDPVLNLAAASAMDLGTASDIVTDYLTAFGLSADDAADFVDIMSYAMSNSNTTTAMLGEAYKNCAATANSMGYSVEEVTAVLMTMSNAGVKGGEAGTALNTIMTRLATDTKSCATALKEYGVEVYDENDNLNSLSDILTGMAGIWDTLTDKEQASLAKTIAGTNQYSALQTIMDGCSESAKAGGQSFSDYAAALESCTGTASKMSDTMVDNLSGDITIMKSAFESLEIAISDKLTDSLRGAAQAGTDFLDKMKDEVADGKLSKAFDNMGTSISNLVENGIDVAADTLPTVINLLAGIINHLDDVVALFVTIKSEAVFKSVITNVANLAEGIKALRTALNNATVAQEALNTAQKANIYAAIATALALVVGGITKYVLSAKEAEEETVELTETQQEAVDAVNELTESYVANKTAREEAAQSVEDEYSGYQTLADKLYELNDVENKTTAQKQEMASIVEQLNSAIPDLNLSIDEETGLLNEQAQSVYDLIEQKKQLAIVNAAIDNLAELELEKEQAQEEYDQVNELRQNLIAEREQLQKEYDKLQKTINENTSEPLISLEEEKELENYKNQLNAIDNQLNEVNVSHHTAYTVLQNVCEEYDKTNKQINEHSALIEADTEAQEDNIDALEDEEEAVEDYTSALEKAKSKVSECKSEITNLISVLDEMNSGTEYSTSQILDLIEKYPELAGAITQTTDGYTVQKQAIEELIKARAKNLEYLAREQLIAASEAVRNAALSEKGEASKAYAEALSYYESVRSLCEDIVNGNIKSGVTSTSSNSSSTSSSTDSSSTTETDEWKAQAEEEIKALDHKYKMGRISAEEYYNQLEAIGEKYYSNMSKYRDEYWAIEEKVYSGRQSLSSSSTSSSSTSASSKSTTSTTDEWKAQAEKEIKTLDHKYNMGRISAEEYYNQLEAINKKYYKGKSKYLDEYRSLEEKVYNGRKSLSSTDKWKEKAEDEISAVEHSYKMGEISATEYYNKLDKINQKYYANKSEYLEEYNDLAEKVYEGRKKEEEDEVKNAQDLVDKLKAVKEAEDDLTNAKKQKVKVYSSSAGFHVESDSTAISEAQDSLSEANSNLNSLLYSMGLITASQATASVSSILKSVDLSEISSSLPNLSGLKLTSTGSSSSTAEKSYNINVTYNAGDIKISGSADSTTVNKITSAMEKDIKTLFEKFIREYFSKANLTRMIGG